MYFKYIKKSAIRLFLIISLVFIASITHGMSLSMMLANQQTDTHASKANIAAMPCHKTQSSDQPDEQLSNCLACHFCIASTTFVIENTRTLLISQPLPARYVINAPLNLNAQHYPPAIRPPII